MSEAKAEQKQAQGQQQLTFDPNNPDPFRKRAQLAGSGGEDKRK